MVTNMSIPSSQKNSPVATKGMLIGALLRVPAQAIQRRIIKELNAAGFDELSMAHMAVLQFPGPEGARPGTLAERAGMSPLNEGQKVSFDVVADRRTGKSAAENLRAT